MSEGYFDLQVNGYGGIDYNQENLTAEELHRSCERLQADGVAGILATFITDTIPTMSRRISRLVELRARDPLAQKLITGIHIEGPFINEIPGYRGAHPVDSIHPTNLDELKHLLDAAAGLTRIVTLAPERDPHFQATRLLASQKIVVSAGHTDASLDDLRGGIDAGLTMFTHLGNGCPMQMHRHDNIINRALSLADQLWLCFIADGVHVPFFLLKTMLKSAGLDRCLVVTDAIAPAGLGPGSYTVGRWNLVIGEDLTAWAPDRSHFVGSALSMPRAVENLHHHLGLNDREISLLTSSNPRRALGVEVAAR